MVKYVRTENNAVYLQQSFCYVGVLATYGDLANDKHL